MPNDNQMVQPATFQPVRNADEWRRILARLPDPHVLQSWEWGEIKGQTGWNEQRFSMHYADGGLLGAFQLLQRRAPARLPFSIGYIPKGPILDWAEQGAVDAALDIVQRIARRERCLFIKIDPNVREDQPEGMQLLQKMRDRGWSFSAEQVQFKNTAYSVLNPEDPTAAEELLAQMKNKWRYNIRLAERRGIAIREGNEEDLERFYPLYAETSARDGFAIRPFSYYEQVWTRYLAAQREEGNPAGGALLLAEHEEESQPVAGLFLMRYGQSVWYFYGASSERRRRDMPNYLLQWCALSWSRAQGATRYDWWGAPTNPDDADDGMAGVWRFKQGFGAELQTHVGAWDWAPSRLLYQLYGKIMPILSRIV